MPRYSAQHVASQLRSCLKRFKKNEFQDILNNWGCIGKLADDLDLKIQKQSIIEKIVSVCVKRKIKQEEIADLELLYTISHSRTKTWNVYSVEKIGEKWISMEAKTVRSTLQEQLKLYCDDVKVNVREYDNTIWLRIFISNLENIKHSSTNTLYMVYCPDIPVLVMSSIKESQKEYLLQAFVNTMNCHECKDLKLSGHCVWSLMQLALIKFTKNSKQAIPEKTLSVLTRGRKRRHHDLEEGKDENIFHENSDMKRKCLEKLEQSFGPDELPALEKLDYKLVTRFHHSVAGMEQFDTPFNCHVTFEGKNVFEGIYNLGRCGYAKVPLPFMLSKAPNMAKSQFVIQDKEKPSDPANVSKTSR